MDHTAMQHYFDTALKFQHRFCANLCNYYRDCGKSGVTKQRLTPLMGVERGKIKVKNIWKNAGSFQGWDLLKSPSVLSVRFTIIFSLITLLGSTGRCTFHFILILLISWETADVIMPNCEGSFSFPKSYLAFQFQIMMAPWTTVKLRCVTTDKEENIYLHYATLFIAWLSSE